jgi:hypothetical protein
VDFHGVILDALELDEADRMVDVLNLGDMTKKGAVPLPLGTTDGLGGCPPLKPLIPIGAPSSIARIKPFAPELRHEGLGADLRGEAMYVVMLILVKDCVTPAAAH